jgi:hypothetical protein
MRLYNGRLGMRMSVVGAAVAMGVYASSAFGGWVIESETVTLRAVAGVKAGKDGEAVAGKVDEPQVKKYTMWLEGEKARMDVGPVSVIFDGSTGEQIVMLHDKSQYLVMTEEDVKNSREYQRLMKGTHTQPAQPVKPVSTGKTETINGFKTEVYEAQLADQKMIFWVTQDREDAKALKGAMLDAYSRVLANTDNLVDMKSLPGYPVKSVVQMNPRKTKLKDGMVVATPGAKTEHIVKSIKVEKVESEMFKVPTGYERKELPARETEPAGGQGVEKAPAPFGKKAVPVK